MTLECRWCGSPRRFAQPCEACPDGGGIPTDEWIAFHAAQLAALEARREPAPSAVASDRMTSREAAEFYRFPSVKALWAATQRNPGKYPHERRGRRILYIRPRPK